jgi:hypothetical protein
MGGNKTQTQTTNSAPWGAAQPALQLGLNDAQSVYKSGIGSQPFMGSTVVPNARQTQLGLDQMESKATNAAQPAFQNMWDQVRANVSNGGLNSLQRGAIDQLKPIANQKPVEGLGQLNDVQRRAYDLLNPIAGGSGMAGNPYLDQIIDKTGRGMQDAINLQASGMGRTASGANQGVLAREIGDMSSGLRYQDFNTQQGRMDQAIRDIFGIGNQANSQYEADMGRKMDATGSLFNAGQQQQDNINNNASALGNAYQSYLSPERSLMEIGGNYEDLFGRQLNDQLRIHQAQQDQPWNQIGRLNAIASGAGSMGSSGTTTAQGPSRLSAGLGGALGGYSMFGPLGALGGGALGMFG